MCWIGRKVIPVWDVVFHFPSLPFDVAFDLVVTCLPFIHHAISRIVDLQRVERRGSQVVGGSVYPRVHPVPVVNVTGAMMVSSLFIEVLDSLTHDPHGYASFSQFPHGVENERGDEIHNPSLFEHDDER